MQLRYETPLTSEEYVKRQDWRQARLDRCPVHGTAGCGFRRLGTYGRVEPAGMRVARYYCAAAQTTFSLLPDCLAARLPGDLDEVERVVAAVEAAPSVEAAADKLWPDIELPGAIRRSIHGPNLLPGASPAARQRRRRHLLQWQGGRCLGQVGTEGFVLDSVSRDFYQLSGTVGSAPGGIGGMSFDSWENAALIDTGETVLSIRTRPAPPWSVATGSATATRIRGVYEEV